MTFNPFVSPKLSTNSGSTLPKNFNKQDEAGHLIRNLIDKDKISMAETGQDTGPVYEYTRPVVRRVGEWGRRGALKAVPWLPSCVPHPVTKHRIHHFVYFSQLSAYKKGLAAAWLSGHSLAALKALKQPDKTGPLHPPLFA